MSKKRPPATPQPEPAAPVKVIAEHRRCPICWNGNGGYGHNYSSDKDKLKSYYRCQYTTNPQCPPCGHTWTVTVTHHQTVIEHRTVQISTR